MSQGEQEKKVCPDEDFLSGVGSRIVAARKEKGLVQTDLAEALGSDVKTVSRYENGHNAPDVIALHIIGKVTQKSVGWLVGEKEEPAQDELERADRNGTGGTRGLVDPRSETEAAEAAQIFLGYFYFGTRKVPTWLCFGASGPPNDFGGYRPD